MALICAEHRRGCDQFARMSLLKKRIPGRRNWECGTCNYLHQLRWILKTGVSSLCLSCSTGILHAQCISEHCTLSSEHWVIPSSPLPTTPRIIKINTLNCWKKNVFFEIGTTRVWIWVKFLKWFQLKAGRTCWNIFILTSNWNVLKWPFLKFQNWCKFCLAQD